MAQIVVPDNATIATYRPVRGEAARAVTPAYQQMTDHYGTAVVPARVRKPRDKTAVESAVQVINKRVIGYLGHLEWNTLDDLNEAIADRVEEINTTIRRKNGTTRAEVFAAEEAEQLRPLPVQRFEAVQWRQLKVGRNYHISCDHQYYSVPHQLAGQTLRVRLTAMMVTVFDAEQVVCEHQRLAGRRGQYSTMIEHAPAQHQDINGLWSSDWFRHRAKAFGPATEAVIDQILNRHAIEAQGYVSCQNILETLGERDKARLEAACQQLLDRGGHASYTSLKRIMAAITSDAAKPQPQRRPPAPATKAEAVMGPAPAGVRIRGAAHYRTTITEREDA